MKIHPFVLVLAPLLLGCSKADEGAGPPQNGPVEKSAPSKAAPHEQAPAQHGGAEPASGPGTAVGVVTADVPKEWRRIESPSPMHVADFNLPGQGGAEDASLAIYNFGPQAGSVEMNLNRWKKQFEQDPADNAKVTKVERAKGTPITLLDISGKFVPTAMPGMPNQKEIAEARMLAAVIDTKEGAYYAKLVGQKATVDHWAAAFQAMLASMKDRE